MDQNTLPDDAPTFWFLIEDNASSTAVALRGDDIVLTDDDVELRVTRAALRSWAIVTKRGYPDSVLLVQDDHGVHRSPVPAVYVAALSIALRRMHAEHERLAAPDHQ